MDNLLSAPPWWDELPPAPDGPHLWPNTDLCGTCGLSRDCCSSDAPHEHGDWRTLGFVGEYDEIPDGSWDEPGNLTARNCNDDTQNDQSWPFEIPHNYVL